MIHIATVHWLTDRWVDVQLQYLESHAAGPYRTYAFLNGPEVERHSERFDVVETRGGAAQHPVKLNHLAHRALEQADDDDLLVFLDGDAFPVMPLEPALRDMLGRAPLVAIRRDENGDLYPHPSFCATTARFWKALGGDWRRGKPWTLPDGGYVHSEVGARLLRQLHEGGHQWTPLLRTNGRDLHPLLFGVYGDLIYHHGAGYRYPLTRTDMQWIRDVRAEGDVERAREAAQTWRVARNMELDRRVYREIQRDEHFWRKLFVVDEARPGAG
jgi:hypothetical protein